MTHRRTLLLCSGFLALYLGLAATRDSTVPLLPSATGRTWWVHPEPAFDSGVTTSVELTCDLVPTRAGRLTIMVLGTFRLLDGDQVLLANDDLGSWQRPRTVTVPARSLQLFTTHPRWSPAIGLGGDAAPVSPPRLSRGGVPMTAVTASSLSEVRPALNGGLLTVAHGLTIALLLATGALALRAPAGSVAPNSVAPAATTRTAATRGLRRGPVLAALFLLLGFNLSRYPIARGLDADGHVAYARLIATSHSLPSPAAGWQTYHPPLYHSVAAALLAATGSERSLQFLSSLGAFGLIGLVALGLGRRRTRGLVLAAAAPVLLVSAPQASNETTFAALACAALIAACGLPTPSRRRLVIAGLLLGGALLTKYTGVVFALAIGASLLCSDLPARRRLGNLALVMTVAIAVSGWAYLDRWSEYGDPFIGNWDEALGHSYRQPPGFRLASYFVPTGRALVAHPFRARAASLWDSLYVSTVSDGFGRFIQTPTQHLLAAALSWLALPLTVAVGWGIVVTALSRNPPALDRGGLFAILFGAAAMVRFNLKLPYYSTAKGVFLLGLILPAVLAFERGRDGMVARGGRAVGLLLDFALAGFVTASAACFWYR